MPDLIAGRLFSRNKGVGDRRTVCFATALVIVLSQGKVYAASDSASLARFAQGVKAFDAGHYKAALDEFQASFELEPSPNTRFKIAKCYVKLHKLARAHAAFTRAALEAQDKFQLTQEPRHEALRDSAWAEANELKPRLATLVVTAPTDMPPGLRILLDGEKLSRAALGVAVEVDPGRHTVTVSGPRLKTSSSTLNLAPTERLRFQVPLLRLPTAVLRLRFASRPSGLAVSIDGEPLTLAALDTAHYLEPGTHRLTASAPGYLPFVWQKTLADGDEPEVAISLSVPIGTPKWIFFTVGSAAVAALSVGAGLTASAKVGADAERDNPDPFTRTLAAQEALRVRGYAGQAMLGVGGAIAVTAVILAVTTRWRSPATAENGKLGRVSSLAPVVAANGLGLSARWDL